MGANPIAPNAELTAHIPTTETDPQKRARGIESGKS